MSDTPLPWPAERATMITSLGIQLEERDAEHAVASMPNTDRAHQVMGLYHGGAFVALADTTATALCITIQHPDGGPADPATFPVAIQISASLVGNAREGGLRCVSRPAHVGRSTIVVDSRISTDDGRLAAVVTTTHFRPNAAPR